MTTTLKELLAKATKRPWRVTHYGEGGFDIDAPIPERPKDRMILASRPSFKHLLEMSDANGALLCHSANCIEELVEAMNTALRDAESGDRTPGRLAAMADTLRVALEKAETVIL